MNQPELFTEPEEAPQAREQEPEEQHSVIVKLGAWADNTTTPGEPPDPAETLSMIVAPVSWPDDMDYEPAEQEVEELEEPTNHGGDALTDLRSSAMTLPPQVMTLALEQLWTSRETLREWLMSKLVEGVHYGHTPGTKPKLDADGNIQQWKKDGKGGGKYVTVPRDQWQAKKCLYKAGAEFICEIMEWLPMPETDAVGWQMAGSKPGRFVIKCRLVRKREREFIEGVGVGACSGTDDNHSMKMAAKRAMVDAVLNATGLSDLFTQDMEDRKAARENPERAPGVQPPTRTERVSKEDVNDIKRHWFDTLADHDKSKNQLLLDFRAWVQETSGTEFEVNQPGKWTVAALDACRKALGMPTTTELETLL